MAELFAYISEMTCAYVSNGVSLARTFRATDFKTSLSDGNAMAISCLILSICSLDMNGYGAADICKPSIGIISFRITSCSPSRGDEPICASSLKKAAIEFCPRYRDSFGSSSSVVILISDFKQTQRHSILLLEHLIHQEYKHEAFKHLH